jgi:hypothetical protein
MKEGEEMKSERHVSVRTGHELKSSRARLLGLLVGLVVVAAFGATTSRDARAVLPSLPSTVLQWNKIAEDTVLGSGAFQGEGEIYMAYIHVGCRL